MGLLNRFKKSNLAAQTDKKPTLTPYQQTVLQEYAVRFTPTLDSAGFDSYVKIEGSSYGAPIPPSPPPIEFLVTENNNFLMTENNNNLIT